MLRLVCFGCIVRRYIELEFSAMSAVPRDHKSATTSRKPGVERIEAPPEPFGQLGVGRFVLPVLAALSLVLASISGTMWYRSFREADTFSRTTGGSTYQVRSIVGRVLYYRLDFDRDAPFPYSDTTWNYSSFPLMQRPPDGWQETWRKTLGVEWDDMPLMQQPGVASGFWLRVRWRTIFILSSVLPMMRLIQYYRRRGIERQRGFPVDAS